MAGVEISAVLQGKERPAAAIELGGWPRPWIAARAWGVLAWIVPFLVYLRTLAPTIYGLDSVELTTGAYVLGIVHAPGSPLYLILGHLFTWLPVGDVSYRLNLMSACAAALTAYFTYRILLLMTRDRLVALATTWALAFTYYVWVSAVAAEIYALHGTFVAGLLWLGLVWRQQGRPWQLVALALLFGLGLGNHLSLAVLAPGFAWSPPSISPSCCSSVWPTSPLTGKPSPTLHTARRVHAVPARRVPSVTAIQRSSASEATRSLSTSLPK